MRRTRNDEGARRDRHIADWALRFAAVVTAMSLVARGFGLG